MSKPTTIVSQAPRTGIPLVAGARLPLAFIASGLVCYALIAVLFICVPSAASLSRAHPTLLTLVHLWLPGFLMSVCLGAAYQLMPVILGEPLHGEKLAWSHLWLHVLGLPGLLVGFFANNFSVVSIGGTAVGLGIVFFAINTVRTFIASSRRDATAWCFVFAALWLVCTVTAGVILAHNRFLPILNWPTLALVRAHAYLGLGGFFLTLLQGATFQLMPMFMLAQERHKYIAGLGITGVQTGLLFLIPGLAFADHIITDAGVILLCSGLLCSAVSFIATYETRNKLKLEPGLRAFVLGSALMPLALLVGIALLIQSPQATGIFAPATPEAGAAAYISIIVVGVLGLMVPGMLCKIAPFLIWMRVYGPRVGRAAVPPAHTLGNATAEWAWLFLHIAGSAALALGLWRAEANFVRAGAWMLGTAALCFLSSIAFTTRHLFSPQVPRPQFSARAPATSYARHTASITH